MLIRDDNDGGDRWEQQKQQHPMHRYKDSWIYLQCSASAELLRPPSTLCLRCYFISLNFFHSWLVSKLVLWITSADPLQAVIYKRIIVEKDKVFRPGARVDLISQRQLSRSGHSSSSKPSPRFLTWWWRFKCNIALSLFLKIFTKAVLSSSSRPGVRTHLPSSR